MLQLSKFNIYSSSLSAISNSKTLISTINANAFNIAQTDILYQEALKSSDILLPDGISVAWAIRWINGRKLKKIAGADLFFYEMERLQKVAGRCFFLGSSESTLAKLKKRTALEYPNVLVQTYSPPYKSVFSIEDNSSMIEAINAFHTDVLFVGLTAPKQEKWAYSHFDQLEVGHVCCIGAVFDFYAGTVNRAPQWMIKIGLEWFYRLVKEPRRMWRRYLIGNTKFIYYVIREKLSSWRLE